MPGRLGSLRVSSGGSTAAVVTRLLDLSQPGVVYPRLPRLTGSYSQSLRLKAT
jgi:hypothetical protein